MNSKGFTDLLTIPATLLEGVMKVEEENTKVTLRRTHVVSVEKLLKDRLKEDLKLYGKAFTIKSFRPTLMRLGYCLYNYYRHGRIADIENLLIEIQRMLYHGLGNGHIMIHEFNIFASLVKTMTRKCKWDVRDGILKDLALYARNKE